MVDLVGHDIVRFVKSVSLYYDGTQGNLYTVIKVERREKISTIITNGVCITNIMFKLAGLLEIHLLKIF